MLYTESMSYDRSSTYLVLYMILVLLLVNFKTGGGVCIGKTGYGLMRAHMRSRVP